MKLRGAMLIVAAVLLPLACARDDDAGSTGAADSRSAQTPPGERGPGMGDMPEMGGMMSGRMMERMSGHIAAMEGATADSIAAMMPMHRQMLANMIAQMNREMAEMNMAADPSWTATLDSLRSDLRATPGMTPAEMQGMMPAHRGRIQRLMEMHRLMMGQMPM